eukprot:9471887-Pyramimonas_sp.AAC.1
MNLFRKCLRSVIRHRLRPIHAELPRDAKQFRGAMIDLFFNTGPDMQVKKALAMCLPKGDWRKTDRVEYFVPRGASVAIDKDLVSSIIQHG